MKRIFLSTLVLLSSYGVIHAQGEMDAIKLSQNDLTGTARSVAMGGAFGALGGDISGIAINPAGIGIYKSMEVVTTLNFKNTKIKNDFSGIKRDASKFNVEFDNLAFVVTLPVRGSDIVELFNVGFSYNKLKSFDRKYQMSGNPQHNSLTDYMAYRAEGKSEDNLSGWGTDWLAALGYQSALFDPLTGSARYVSSSRYLNDDRFGLPLDNNLSVREKGSVNTYDFNFGTMIADMLSIGMTISATDIDYKLSSKYSEYFMSGDSDVGWYNLFNDLKTEGSGIQLSLGTILKPTDALRIGIAYHSPTWYNMTDYYTADIGHDLLGMQGLPNIQIRDNYEKIPEVIGNDGMYKYKLRTPDRWTFSLAGVIGSMAIISADYELTNYKSNMRLSDRDYGNDISLSNPNAYIKEDFRAASTLRLGAEVRFTPRFSGRVGYAWMQSPLTKEFKSNENEVMTVGAIPHYTLDGDVNHFTYGLGYRFTQNFYADVAFVYKTQKSDLYAFSSGKVRHGVGKVADGSGNELVSQKSSMKSNTFQGLLTFGYKFR